MSDIVKRASKHAREVLDAGYPYYGTPELVRELAAEIARLRAEVERLRATPTLTDAEREALSNAALWLVELQSADDDAAGPGDPRAGECAATLRGLLARLGGER